MDVSQDSALKAKHRAMWAMGDYAAVASDVIAELGPRLVDACGVQPGQQVLDVAAGTGNAAIVAAERGAAVVASDLTPELLEIGQKDAVQRGVTLDWEVADAEALPFDDDRFDAVLSCVGVMFAPHHQESADELLRVCRPGGTIGVLSWTPEGFIGQMFATMKPFAPPPPPSAQPPPLWGDEAHMRELLGDAVTDITVRREAVRIDRFGTAEQFRDFFKLCYGPTIVTYNSLGGDAERVAALDEALAGLGRRFDLGGGAMDWEYLIVTARKAR